MDFDNIKSALDSDEERFSVPSNIDQFKESKLPIRAIIKTMKGEITKLLICIAIFYSGFLYCDLSPLAFSVHLIFITIVCIFMLMYIWKLRGFIKRTNKIGLNTKASIFSILYDLKLVLEVYKTGTNAATILLPIPIAASLMGDVEKGNPELFEKLFLFQGTAAQTMMIVAAYFAFIISVFFLTNWWSKRQYGVHIKDLDDILEILGD